MDDIAVLVLNYTYEPLHFTNARRAITLLLAGKAESVEGSPRVIRSPSRSFHLPSVIRLGVYIRKPFLERVAFNKKNILRRDGYTCQYCRRRGEKLTVDHVIPRSRGGQTTWTNVVAACLPNPAHLGDRMTGKTCAGLWVTGRKDGRPKQIYLYQVADNETCMRRYGVQAVVWQTAVNPVIALELIAQGTWRGVGVLGPEAFDPDPFLERMPAYDFPFGVREMS